MTSLQAWAIAIIAGYLVLCWYFLRHKRAPEKLSPKSGDKRDQLLVGFASQSGQAEYLAQQYADSFEEKYAVILVTLNQIDDSLIRQCSKALFIVSTYGEGEPPDNALRFQQQWLRKPVADALPNLQFAVLALGDSEYRQYCGFGTALAEGLTRNGAHQLFETVTVDCMNAQDLLLWQHRLSRYGFIEEHDEHPEFHEKVFAVGMLVEQRRLNTGSPGAPVWHLRIKPPLDCSWQAGDILEIRPGNEPEAPIREYSIASIVQDDSLDLLVRQVIRDDGSLGIGSGWLVHDASPGDDILLRVRSNPVFHAPDTDKPMILIGNGTGLAGLRAHLKAREAAGANENCLFFGERTREHDFYFREEIESWHQKKMLPELHLAFSRDQEQRLYVQNLLKDQANKVREWVSRGAVIYVCGSLEGMASGVDSALQEILGSQKVADMKIAGTYARDVY